MAILAAHRRFAASLFALFVLMLFSAAMQARAQTEGTFQNAGLTLHYTALGKGSPVLLLSGGPGMDVDYMLPLAQMIATQHTAILLQQRGTGKSMPAVISKETVNDDLLLSDMEALRTKLGYAQWTLLGHSAGAVVAEFYAIAHPGAVKAMVLLGALPPTLAEVSKAEATMMARLTPEAKARMAELSGQAQLMAKAGKDEPETQSARMMEMLRLVFVADFYDAAAGQKFAATQTANNFHVDTMNQLELYRHGYDLRADLGKLHIPTLIVQGSADPYDAQLAGETRDAIPGAKMVVVPNAGHFGWLEQPDAYATALNSFLKDK